MRRRGSTACAGYDKISNHVLSRVHFRASMSSLHDASWSNRSMWAPERFNARCNSSVALSLDASIFSPSTTRVRLARVRPTRRLASCVMCPPGLKSDTYLRCTARNTTWVWVSPWTAAGVQTKMRCARSCPNDKKNWNCYEDKQHTPAFSRTCRSFCMISMDFL
jgi:hypothetical protein